MREVWSKVNEWFEVANVPKKDRGSIVDALRRLPDTKALQLVEDAILNEWPLDFMKMELNIGEAGKGLKVPETFAPVIDKNDHKRQEEVGPAEVNADDPDFEVVEDPSGDERETPVNHQAAVEKPRKKGFKMPSFGMSKLKGLLMKPSNKPGKEVATKRPGKSGSFMDKLPSNKTMLISTGVGLVVVILFLGWFWNFGMRGAGSSGNYDFGISDLPANTESLPTSEPFIPNGELSDNLSPQSVVCGKTEFLVFNRYPDKSIIGTRPFSDLLMRQNSGTEFDLQIYRVAPIKGLEDMLMVQQDGNIYYVPSSSFPPSADETKSCLSLEEAGGFIVTQQRLSPEPLTARVTGTSKWFPVMIVTFGVMIVGAIFAIWVGGRTVEFILMTSIIISSVFLTPTVPVDGLGWLYVFGLVASIALGSRGEVKIMASAMERSSSQSNVSGELEGIVRSARRGFGIIGGIDWSSAGWWCGLNLAFGLVNPSLSPLHILYGSTIAFLFLVLQILFFFALEAYRRGTKGDWGGYLITFVGLVYVPIFIFIKGTTTMYLTSLITGMVVLLVLMVIGLSSREEINKDRLPDSLFLFGSIVLASLTAVILFF